MAPTTCQLLVLLQVVNLVSSQANIEPHDNSELSPSLSVMRPDRALKLSEYDSACPHCNIMNEVSCVNQQFSQ